MIGLMVPTAFGYTEKNTCTNDAPPYQFHIDVQKIFYYSSENENILVGKIIPLYPEGDTSRCVFLQLELTMYADMPSYGLDGNRPVYNQDTRHLGTTMVNDDKTFSFSMNLPKHMDRLSTGEFVAKSTLTLMTSTHQSAKIQLMKDWYAPSDYVPYSLPEPDTKDISNVEESVQIESTEKIDDSLDNNYELESTSNGGGCLIATAAFGSEMAPQVQFLREIRDNTVMTTQSGTAFMTGFNQFYYSFSPHVADYERENPVFKEMVKLSLTPLLTSLTLLNYVDIDTEEEMLGYGIGIILLNIGMYFVAPAVLIISLKKRLFL